MSGNAWFPNRKSFQICCVWLCYLFLKHAEWYKWRKANLPPQACFWVPDRHSWCQSWCLGSGYNEGSKGSHNLASAIWQLGSGQLSSPLSNNRTILKPKRIKWSPLDNTIQYFYYITLFMIVEFVKLSNCCNFKKKKEATKVKV